MSLARERSLRAAVASAARFSVGALVESCRGLSRAFVVSGGRESIHELARADADWDSASELWLLRFDLFVKRLSGLEELLL